MINALTYEEMIKKIKRNKDRWLYRQENKQAFGRERDTRAL